MTIEINDLVMSDLGIAVETCDDYHMRNCHRDYSTFGTFITNYEALCNTA